MAVLKTFEALAAHLKTKGDRVVKAAADATDNFADFIVVRGQANAPVQSGALQASIHKEAVPAPAGETVRDIVAGGPTAPYAPTVHNRPPELDHAHEGESTPEGFPGRQFLTRPARFHRAEFAQGVRQAVGEVLRGKA